jgi:hypothetical protein
MRPISSSGVDCLKSSATILTVLILGVFMQACTTVSYVGPVRHDNEIAVVRTSGLALVNGVTIYGVDDMDFDIPRRGIAILAGEHRLKVGKDYVRSADQMTHILFTAEAGHQYVVKSFERVPGACRFWVEDRENGEVVGE